MAQKLLTIIVPTYNVEEYLPKCLSSIVVDDDTLRNMLEVIVVNDGSKDGSSEIAHYFEQQYPSILKVIDKDNGNYGSCINLALPLATGKYVKVVDADDSLDTPLFEKYLWELQAQDVDLVLNDMTIVDAEDKQTGEWTIGVHASERLSFEDIASHYEDFFIHKFAYRRSLLEDIGYSQTEGISYSDNEWVAKPMTALCSAYYISLPIYRYLRGRSNQTVSRESKRKSFESLRSMVLSLGRIWKDYDGEENRRSCLYNLFMRQLRSIYSEFFVLHYFNRKEFRVFDKTILKTFPEVADDSRITDHVDSHYCGLPMLSIWRLQIHIVSDVLLTIHSWISIYRANHRI